MPKYFFDVTDGTNRIRDVTGGVFENNAAALKHAVSLAEGLSHDEKYKDAYVEIWNAAELRVGKAYITLRH
jgi:hypothetical protein